MEEDLDTDSNENLVRSYLERKSFQSRRDENLRYSGMTSKFVYVHKTIDRVNVVEADLCTYIIATIA